MGALHHPHRGAPDAAVGRGVIQGNNYHSYEELVAERESFQSGGSLSRLGVLASQVEISPTAWLWRHRIPVGMVGMIDGDPGMTKSTLVAEIAAHVTTGKPWPDGSPCPKGSVIIVGSEDSTSQTVKPRLMAAGADMSKVLLVGLIDDGLGGKRMPSIPGDIPLFEKVIRDMGAVLIVFDPIMPYLAAELSANSDKDVRQALTPLAEMLDRTQCAGALLRHLNKSNKVEAAIYRGLGSIGFIGVSRWGMVVARDKEDEDTFVLMMQKANGAPLLKARRYSIERVDLPSPKGIVETSHIVWGDESDHQANEMLTAFGGEGKKKDAGREMMLSLLKDGPVDSKSLIEAMEARGIARRTIWRIKDELGVKAQKKGFNDGWEWYLPPSTKAANFGPSAKAAIPGPTAEILNSEDRRLPDNFDGMLRVLDTTKAAKAAIGMDPRA